MTPPPSLTKDRLLLTMNFWPGYSDNTCNCVLGTTKSNPVALVKFVPINTFPTIFWLWSRPALGVLPQEWRAGGTSYGDIRCNRFDLFSILIFIVIVFNTTYYFASKGYLFSLHLFYISKYQYWPNNKSNDLQPTQGQIQVYLQYMNLEIFWTLYDYFSN